MSSLAKKENSRKTIIHQVIMMIIVISLMKKDRENDFLYFLILFK